MTLEEHSGNPQVCRIKYSSERHCRLRTEKQEDCMNEDMPTHCAILT